MPGTSTECVPLLSVYTAPIVPVDTSEDDLIPSDTSMPDGDFLDLCVDPAPPVPQQPSPTPPSSPQVKTEPVNLTPECPQPFFALKSPTPAPTMSAHPTSSLESPAWQSPDFQSVLSIVVM
jgi:hypothetical protein